MMHRIENDDKIIRGVGFTGKMKSGKDTSASILTNQILKWKGSDYTIKQLAFADALKEICMNYLGLTKHMCYDQDGKAEFNDFWGMTNREILQRVGTEAMRNGFHPDVWVKIVDIKLKKIINDNQFFIVTDIRFPNEAEIIRKNGGIVVEITRPFIESSIGIKNHLSEQELPNSLIDWRINNNGSLLDLEDSIKEIITYLKIMSSPSKNN